MKANYTHLSVLVDRSYSMIGLKDAVIEGINGLISTQKQEPGELTMTYADFDTAYDVHFSFKNIQDVQLLTDKDFVPRGSTALNYAMARLIDETGKRLAEMSEDERPEKVLFVVYTDGAENASPDEWYGANGSRLLKEKIEHQASKYNWQFVYLGANQDAFAVGSSLGMTGGANFQANDGSAKASWTAISKKMSFYRSASVGSEEYSRGFTVTTADVLQEEKEQEVTDSTSTTSNGTTSTNTTTTSNT